MHTQFGYFVTKRQLYSSGEAELSLSFEAGISGEYHLSRPPNLLVLTLETRVEVLVPITSLFQCIHEWEPDQFYF